MAEEREHLPASELRFSEPCAAMALLCWAHIWPQELRLTHTEGRVRLLPMRPDCHRGLFLYVWESSPIDSSLNVSTGTHCLFLSALSC